MQAQLGVQGFEFHTGFSYYRWPSHLPNCGRSCIWFKSRFRAVGEASRTAILLIGGDKTGNDRWYEQFVPIADRIYEQYLEEIRKGRIECERQRTDEVIAGGFEAIRDRIRQIEATALRQLCSRKRARHLRAVLATRGKL